MARRTGSSSSCLWNGTCQPAQRWSSTRKVFGAYPPNQSLEYDTAKSPPINRIRVFALLDHFWRLCLISCATRLTQRELTKYSHVPTFTLPVRSVVERSVEYIRRKKPDPQPISDYYPAVSSSWPHQHQPTPEQAIDQDMR